MIKKRRKNLQRKAKDGKNSKSKAKSRASAKAKMPKIKDRSPRPKKVSVTALPKRETDVSLTPRTVQSIVGSIKKGNWFLLLRHLAQQASKPVGRRRGIRQFVYCSIQITTVFSPGQFIVSPDRSFSIVHFGFNLIYKF
ncbi:MAG: hypothetical protein DWQ05_17885 [Calditrichaeota bacterium]|nr:MAG: hypothetical protein DWQ05_17885 [Calditrichota bacterium]